MPNFFRLNNLLLLPLEPMLENSEGKEGKEQEEGGGLSSKFNVKGIDLVAQCLAENGILDGHKPATIDVP